MTGRHESNFLAVLAEGRQQEHG